MESDSEFLDRMENDWVGDRIPNSDDAYRLFALARRSAAPGWEWMREQAAKVAEDMPIKGHGNLATAPYAAAEQVADEIAAAIRALPPPPDAPSGWRPIETAPRDGTRVLLTYRNTLNKGRRVIAFYAPKLTIEQTEDADGWCDYDEPNDRYCLPEGWYECIDNWDDYTHVHISGVTPTHWLPLPPPPAEGEK